jgi:hypothetical protein
MKAGSFKKSAAEGKSNREYAILPEGNYTVRLTNVTTDETKDPARVQFEFTTLSRRKCWKSLTMKETEPNINYVNGQLELLGIAEAVNQMAEENPEELMNRVIYNAGADMMDSVYDITIKHSSWNGKARADVELSANGPLPGTTRLKEPTKAATPTMMDAMPDTMAAPAGLDTNEEIPF